MVLKNLQKKEIESRTFKYEGPFINIFVAFKFSHNFLCFAQIVLQMALTTFPNAFEMVFKNLQEI